jgi:acetyl esterase/lipase
MTYAYDPELAPIVAALPQLDISDIAAARAQMRAMREALPPFVKPDGVTVAKRTVSGPPGDPDIELAIFRPEPQAARSPALYWIHGGGFVLGDVDGDMAAPAQFAGELGAVVVSVEYRLAPEHPFPAPVEDCYAGLVWMSEHAEDLGFDPRKLAIGGLSAGGGLAAAVALMARDRGGPALCFQVLDIPELDDRLSTPSMRQFTDTPLWNHPNAVTSWQAYLGPGRRETPVYAAPARAADLSGLPPAYVVTCEFDPLRDEGIEYAQRLMQAGVPAELHHYPGTFHGSSGAGAGTAISTRMVTDRLAALARAYARCDELAGA